MKSIEDIKMDYPLHWLIWKNDVNGLSKALDKNKFDKEKLDPRGRTPLMLAVKLANLRAVKCLLQAKCNANYEHEDWSIVQEAICTGNSDILTAIVEVRDFQRHTQRVTQVPQLLQHLLDAPDFYIEIKLEFTSWVPLMSRMCPNDTYKVYKRGANVRIDTTLIGFENNSWQRGNRSYIFKGTRDTATMFEIDHITQEVFVQPMGGAIGEVCTIPPPPNAIKTRLSTPVITNHLEMDKISFERNLSGIWGWRSEKSELINGYNCKVYGASNVELVTKTRMDHLSDEQIKSRTARSPLHSLLGITDDDYIANNELTHFNDNALPSYNRENEATEATVTAGSSSNNQTADTPSPSVAIPNITPEEYFSEEIDLSKRDIGRAKKLSVKVQRFKANLWLSEEYPIRLQEQVLPILDLMSTMASPHVSKLKDFIMMQLPNGFPVKIEVPILHILNACITFGNVFGMTTPVEHITTLDEGDRLTCLVDDRSFAVPVHYARRDLSGRRQVPLDEVELLQYAIEQSLVETNGARGGSASSADEDSERVDIWEALRGKASSSGVLLPEDDVQFQRALQESLLGPSSNAPPPPAAQNHEIDNGVLPCIDPDLEFAMRLSQQDQTQYEAECKREEELLAEVIKLSLEEH